jgi:uncharacterized protein YidB (DUF937 family)
LKDISGNSPEENTMNTQLRIAIVAVAVVAVLAVLGVGFAFAQGMSPWGTGYGMMGGRGGMMAAYQSGTPAPGDGYGMMGNGHRMGNGQGMLGGMGMNGMAVMAGVDMDTMRQWMADSGAMRTAVWNGLADAIGLTPDALNTELTSGQTLAQIAEAQGVTQSELAEALETSLKVGLNQAVAEGTLTQAQADQMLSHMAGNYEWMINHIGIGMGFGAGNCHGSPALDSNS